MAHQATQQITSEIIELYYDYAKGAANGALLPDRTKSLFVVVPRWCTRPMPPKDKHVTNATDAELGLIA